MNGGLPVSEVEEVVAGWSSRDGAWHLGLLLGASVANARGGRWCELARWSDATVETSMGQVEAAGARLAQVLNRPFRLVRPSPVTVAAWQEASGHSATSAVSAAGRYQHTDTGVMRVGRARPEAAIELPLEMGGLLLKPIEGGLQWSHVSVWSLSVIARILFRIALGIVFLWLSVLTLQSPYASVQPTFLPYLGILIGLGMLYSTLRLMLSLLRAEFLTVDRVSRRVMRHRELTNDVIEAYPFEEIRAVVVTQIAQQRHRKSDGQPDTMTHEAWLHLLLREARQVPGKHRNLKPEDAYITFGHIDLTEGEIVEAHFEGKKNQRPLRLLYADEATTPAQKAAVAIARAIGVDAYIDQR